MEPDLLTLVPYRNCNLVPPTVIKKLQSLGISTCHLQSTVWVEHICSKTSYTVLELASRMQATVLDKKLLGHTWLLVQTTVTHEHKQIYV